MTGFDVAVSQQRHLPSRNHTRAKLDGGQPVFGCFLRYPDAGLAELIALQGLDFIVFDGEHGTLTPQSCEHLIRAVELHDVTPLVRVEENRASSILRYLDAGALGCHIPGVDSADDARQAVRAAKFRPEGDRGLAGSRASGYGPRAGYAAYVAAANRESLVIAQVETATGVAAAPAIAEVAGIDVLLVGTLDLSHDLGVPGEVGHPAVVAAVAEVAAAADTAGKTFGAVVGGPETVRDWLERGARYLLTPVESFLTPGVKRYITELGR